MSVLLNVMERMESGKKIRKMGYVPGVVYGPGIDRNVDVQVKAKEINRFLKRNSTSVKTRIKVREKELTCVIKNIQYEPATNKPIHIDFYVSSEDKPVKVKVSLRFKGKQQLTRKDLVLNILQNEIEVQGLLKDLPEFVDVDVSQIAAGSVITVGDIVLPEGIKLLSPKDEVIASVSELSQSETEESIETDVSGGTDESV